VKIAAVAKPAALCGIIRLARRKPQQPPRSSTRPEDTTLAKPNFEYQKRQRELEKKKKQEEKRLKKQERAAATTAGEAPPPAAPDEAPAP
jgi:hypothetical protein